MQISADTSAGQRTASPSPPAARAPQDSSAKPAGGSASPIYYKRSQLDARPHIITKVEPEYPSGVPPTGGTARVRLFINERGLVDRVVVVDSTPPAKFGEAAATAFRSAQFKPGARAGVAVKSQILIEVTFRPLLPPGMK